MKNKLFKSIMAAAMMGTILVGTLTGCGAKTDKPDADKPGTTVQDDVADEDRPDTWIADRKITVQAYVSDIGNSLPEDMMSTPVAQEIKRLTGIELDIQYTPGDSDSAVLASHLASGTIPDAIVTYLNNSARPEFTLLLKGAKEDMFADLSPYLADMKVYSKYLEDDYLPSDAKNNITFRDDLEGAYVMQLSIPRVDRSLEYNAAEEYIGGPYIRKDIAEDLGITSGEIRTAEQFHDLLVQIKNGGYTDKNGQSVYPLGPKFWGGTPDTLDYITRPYNWGVSSFYNIDTDGEIKHEVETDYVYKKIDYVRQLLAEGLMNPEFFTMDDSRSREAVETGNSAIVADIHNYMDVVYESGEWIPLGLLNDYTGDNSKIVRGKGGYGAFAVSSQTENPEEVLAFFDFLATEQGMLLGNYGIEGEHYDMVDGKPVVKEEVLEYVDSGDAEWLINEVGASFGGLGLAFWEYAMTDIDWLDQFGESRPGASAGTGFQGAIDIATNYPVTKRLVKGLDATSYLTDDSLQEVNAQMSLLEYKEVLVQAMFATSDAEVTEIVESFRNQLEQAGLQQFKDHLKTVYEEDPDNINFYPID